MALARPTVQRMPDGVMRWATTARQPAAKAPRRTKMPSPRKQGQRIRGRWDRKWRSSGALHEER